jgi:RNA polymerase sigma factor (sigma-70 family)
VEVCVILAALKSGPDAESSPLRSRGAAAAADEERLETVIREHGVAVRAFLIQRYAGTLNAADVDDGIAVAIHRMWARHEALRDLRSPRAWFLRVADNVLKDVLRHGWQKARQLEVAADRAFLESLPEAREERIAPEISSELREALRQIVADLPEKQRRIIWADALHPEGALASETLASELGIPPGTVRVYRKRALDRIRRELNARNLGPE